MSNRNAILRQVDALVERFGPFDNADALELLRQGLNALFQPANGLQDPPHIQEDVGQWLRNVEEYLGGRLVIEPEEDLDVRSLMAMRGESGGAV